MLYSKTVYCSFASGPSFKPLTLEAVEKDIENYHSLAISNNIPWNLKREPVKKYRDITFFSCSVFLYFCKGYFMLIEYSPVVTPAPPQILENDVLRNLSVT